MVSIEQIQRANALSKELKKHGFATDFGDAYDQADKIFSREKISPEIEFANGDTVLVQQQGVDETVSVLKERVQALERHKEFSQVKESEYKRHVAELRSQIQGLVKSLKLLELNQQSFQKQMNEVKRMPQEQSVAHVAVEPAKQEKLSKPIDRNGVAPSEIVIEDIFYSGSRR